MRGWRFAIPSRFIDELPPENVSVETQPGLYGGYRTNGISSFDPDEDHDFGGRHRGAYREKLLDAAPWQSEDHGSASKTFDVDDRIFHQKFGYGRVLVVDGNKLEIAFEKAGVKKVMSSFVEDA